MAPNVTVDTHWPRDMRSDSQNAQFSWNLNKLIIYFSRENDGVERCNGIARGILIRNIIHILFLFKVQTVVFVFDILEGDWSCNKF